MNFSFLPKYLPYFNYGAVVTILISICVIFLGTILGVVLAFGQCSKFKPLVWLANLYVWIFRGTPMMVQIMIAFALMHINAPTIQIGILGVDFSRLIPGILIISMNSGAYVSETVRAGINAVPKGQLEAAYSLGIRPKNAMRYVILPQAVKNIFASIGERIYHHYQGQLPLISYWGHGVVEWGYNSFYNNLSTFNTTFICSILLLDYDLYSDSSLESF